MTIFWLFLSLGRSKSHSDLKTQHGAFVAGVLAGRFWIRFPAIYKLAILAQGDISSTRFKLSVLGFLSFCNKAGAINQAININLMALRCLVSPDASRTAWSRPLGRGGAVKRRLLLIYITWYIVIITSKRKNAYYLLNVAGLFAMVFVSFSWWFRRQNSTDSKHFKGNKTLKFRQLFAWISLSINQTIQITQIKILHLHLWAKIRVAGGGSAFRLNLTALFWAASFNNWLKPLSIFGKHFFHEFLFWNSSIYLNIA